MDISVFEKYRNKERMWFDAYRGLSNFFEEDTNRHINRYKKAAGFVGEHDNVLDIACGCGYGSYFLNALTYIGVDVSPESISFAKDVYQRNNVDFVLSNACYFDIKNIDFICSIETIEHIDDYKGFLKKCKEGLTESGKIFITTIVDILVNNENTFHNLNFSLDNMLAECEDLGFRLIYFDEFIVETTFKNKGKQTYFLYENTL